MRAVYATLLVSVLLLGADAFRLVRRSERAGNGGQCCFWTGCSSCEADPNAYCNANESACSGNCGGTWCGDYPTPTPGPVPTPGGTCESQWDNVACDAQGGCHTCGGRITWLMENRGESESQARNSVAVQFPQACGACATATPTPVPSPPPTPATTNAPSPGDLPARDVLPLMGRGVNLGNIYDYDSGNDMSFESQAARIDSFHAKGFTHVRVPVTWGERFTYEGKYVIAEQVVRYAIQKGLYVILNTHHEHWLKAHYDESDHYNNAYTALWTSIATLFKDEGNKLVFEVLNEPDGVMGGYGPGQANPNDPTAIRLTRAANLVGYNAIRAVSPKRVVLLMPNGMGQQQQAKVVYPTRDFLPGGGQDPYLGVSVHTYDPWDFCGEDGRNSYFSSVQSMKDHEVSTHAQFLDWVRLTNIPVHVGEYGVGRKPDMQDERNTEVVHEYYKFVTNFFVDEGIPTTVWEDQGWFAIMTGTGDFTYGLADSILATYGGTPTPAPSPVPTTPSPPTTAPTPTPVDHLPAREILPLMGRGVNLGNIYDFGDWNDMSFETQAARIDSFHAKGFTHVRVPVTWGERFTYEGKYVIAEQVVRYAIQKGLYVILNTHHEHWLKAHYDESDHYNNAYTALWTSIATLFKDEGNKLVFEVLNEPDGVMGGYGPGQANPNDWNAIRLTRAANLVGYNAIRAVSPKRVVLLMPNGMGQQQQARVVYPTRSDLPSGGHDSYLGVSVHTYDPWDFCGEDGRNSYFSDIGAMYGHQRNSHAQFLDWVRQTNIPVHIGEYGVGRKPGKEYERNAEMVHEYYKFITNMFFTDYGIPTTVWDDQGWFSILTGAGNFTYGLADSILATY